MIAKRTGQSSLGKRSRICPSCWTADFITATIVSPGNVGDASAGQELISDLLEKSCAEPETTAEPETVHADDLGDGGDCENSATVYGDNAYGTGG